MAYEWGHLSVIYSYMLYVVATQFGIDDAFVIELLCHVVHSYTPADMHLQLIPEFSVSRSFINRPCQKFHSCQMDLLFLTV